MRKKNYTFWLVIIYLIMAAVCAALIVLSKQSLTSIIINVAMFLIVAIIFGFAINKFSIGWRLQKALSAATAKIREDARSDRRYLWDQYKKESGGGLFRDDILTPRYQKFLAEMKRLEQFKNADYKCDIEDYINKEYVDASMKKNILNLVSGTMTGLGILGTFVGLSFGLQYFNTGTSAEITDSIAPLMDGIKVAFHTSVYGMVFSLVFSFVYKASMEAVYVQLEEFLSTFNTYVLGDSLNDNESTMRELIQALPKTLGQNISEHISESLTPVVYNMNKTMMDFAQDIAQNQSEGMNGLVNEFIDKLNRSMGGTYTMFGQMIQETVNIQRENNAYAQNIMNRLGEVTGHVNDINALSMQIIDSMSGYISQIEKLQNIINENYSSTYRQMETLKEHEERMQGYVYAISAHEKEVNDSIKQELSEIIKMSGAFSGEIQSTSQKLSNMLTTAKSDIDTAARELASASSGLDERLTRSLSETFNLFDTNMAKVTQSLSDTILQIDRTTERVPEVVLAAYDGMKQSFDQLQGEMNVILQNLNNAGR
ncbi:MAG: MotA/TolQ/ExbB proton channel family protein [Parasporobacterium sp.]|nr:MotA/TolQ/ExbB proton channel family protein [Parasporobacterium sp.]